MKRRFARFHFLGIVLCCLFSQGLSAERSLDTLDSQVGGVKFRSKEFFVPDRTSLSLFPDHKKLNFDFTLSFDCSIYNAERFGYIFRIIDQQNEVEQPVLHLLYNNHINGDLAHQNDTLINLELYAPVTQAKLVFIIPVSEQKKLRIKLQYDALRQTIKMNCNGVEKQITDLSLNEGVFDIIFGLWGQNTDVAAMELRNIRMREDGKTKLFWPLHEFAGEYALEQVSGIKSEIKNPVWLRKEHFHWRKLKSFAADEMVGVVYKERTQRLYFVNKDSLVIFSPVSGEVEMLKYTNERPFTKQEHYSIYRGATDETLSYDFRFFKSSDRQRMYSVLNEDSLTWSEIATTSDFAMRYHHSVFWGPGDDRVTIFGGYGDFEYSNAFSTYDFSKDSWSTLAFNGDTIYPRTHTVIGRDTVSGLVYIYGGFGNEQGQQALGGRTFYDLYAVDISSYKIEKLLDYPGNDLDFVPRGHLIVDNSGKDFYTLGSQMIERSFLRLYHIDPINETIEATSDSISVTFTNMAGDVFLFKNDAAQELYCVSRENSAIGNSLISVYRLKFPPSDLQVATVLPSPSYTKFATLLIVALLVGVAGSLYLTRKRSTIIQRVRSEKPIEWSRAAKNAIWLLGGFKVYDSEGRDISYRFSTKLRELFLLVFFETIHNQGIGSAELSEALWPGMDKNQKKNNRGVTISNLRKALEDLQDIKLINANKKWRMEYGEAFYCDFLELNAALENSALVNKPHYLVAMLSYGDLLPNLQFAWLNQHTNEYKAKAKQLLHRICTGFYAEKKYLSCLETARVIHEKFDPLDELAMQFKIKALNKMKSYKKAQDEFELFKKRYHSIYHSEYGRTLHDIENLQPNSNSLI